jgi:hypothetical protein
MTAVLLRIAATVLAAVLSGCAAMQSAPSVGTLAYPPYHQIAGSVDSGGVIAGTGGGARSTR